jgi:hypothetical protein
VIGQFSGGFAIKQPIISVTGNAHGTSQLTPQGLMKIIFTSDSNTHRAGFRAEITTSSCPNNCGNHGYCYFNTCICDVGYRGVSCEQGIRCHGNHLVSVSCDNDCSAHGWCSDSQCQCSELWLGNDCSVCNEDECIQGTTNSCPIGGIVYNQLNVTNPGCYLF